MAELTLSRELRTEEAGGESRGALLPDEARAAALTPADRRPSLAELARVLVEAGEATAVLSMERAVTLVFPRGLRAMAKALLGTRVVCSVCGRSGVVTRLRLETKRRGR